MQTSHRSRDSIPLHSTYLTASDLGLRAPRETRERLWGTIPRDQALVLLASMLADADSNGQLAGDRRDIDREWVARIEDPNLRQRVQMGLTLHNVLLAPQLLVLAIREALELCPPGPALNGASGTEAVVACLLGIGDEEQAGRGAAGDPTRWAGLDPKLAADLVANMYFNSSIALHHLMATTEATWTSPWPDLAPAGDRATINGDPAELFFEATGVRPEAMQQIAVHLYVQYMTHGHLRFPPEFFDRAGVDPGDLVKVLDLISTDAATLSGALSRGASGWEFNPLRRWPLLRLDDGNVLVLRLGWLLERVLSDVTYFDIRKHLKDRDKADGTHRDAAFNRCVQAKLEADTGAALRRTFLRRGGQVWHESELHAAWQGHSARSRRPKICDYVVRVGHYWLLVDATDRAIPVDVVAGLAGTTGIDAELNHVLTGRKAEQLDSTIALLRAHMTDLTGQPPDPEAVFIPIVATPTGGLPWMHIVSVETGTQLAARGLLQDLDVLPAALMSPKDLSLLEKQSESRGVGAIKDLVDWRQGVWAHWPFDGYLHLTGHRLNATKREQRAAERIMRTTVCLSKENLDRLT